MFEMLRDKFSGDDGKDRLYGLGLLASQLGSGQAPNAGPALQMLKERQTRNALKQQMQGGDFMGKFSDQEQAFLATLPPEAAQQLIAQRIFAAPAEPRPPIEINGQLVDPDTYQVVGDFRTPEAADPTYQTMTPEEVAAIPGLNPSLTYQRSPTGQIQQVDGSGVGTAYIATGEGAASLGLDPNKSYNVAAGPEGVKATEIGGSGTSVIVNNNGDPTPEIGVIPQGYQAIQDPVTGDYSYKAIPGGPEDTTKADEAASGNRENSSRVITNAFTRADQADNQRVLGGFLGGLAAANPSTDNAEVYRQVQSLKSVAKVENLQAMRNASPTGGALGSVSAPELTMLEAMSGALDPASPNFKRDLADYTRTLLGVVHGPEAGDRIFAEIQPPGGGNSTSSGVTWSIVE